VGAVIVGRKIGFDINQNLTLILVTFFFRRRLSGYIMV